MTAPSPPTDPPPVEVPGERPGRTWAKVLAGIFLVISVGFWLWLIFLADEQTPPDRMDDPAFAEAAEPICSAGQDAVDALPPARTADTPEERAVVLEEANGELQAMVDELRAIAPTTGRDGDMVQEWLDDWEVYLGDRSRHAERLAAGEDPRFQLTAKSGDQITEAIDGFAEANEMDSCTTPLDV